MTTKAASVGKLGELHEKVAQVMSDALEVVEVAQRRYLENEEEAVEAPPSMPASLLSVMVKFLADNSITAAPEESTGMSELETKLNARKTKRRMGANAVSLFDTDE